MRLAAATCLFSFFNARRIFSASRRYGWTGVLYLESIGILQRRGPKTIRDAKLAPVRAVLRPDKFGSRGGNATKVLGRWVRSLGIVDERISPNHSWRHRFKTLARRHGLATDVVDALVGHQRRTVADSYGEFPASALQRELEKIPLLIF